MATWEAVGGRHDVEVGVHAERTTPTRDGESTSSRRIATASSHGSRAGWRPAATTCSGRWRWSGRADPRAGVVRAAGADARRPTERLRAELVAAVDGADGERRRRAGPTVAFDDTDSPWYTVCRVTADRRAGDPRRDRSRVRRRRRRRALGGRRRPARAWSPTVSRCRARTTDGSTPRPGPRSASNLERGVEPPGTPLAPSADVRTAAGTRCRQSPVRDPSQTRNLHETDRFLTPVMMDLDTTSTSETHVLYIDSHRAVSLDEPPITASETRWPLPILNWPEDAERNVQLADERRPRLLLVAHGAEPPVDLDGTSDWVRRPATARDVYARIEALQRRCGAIPPSVHLDDNASARRRRSWVALAPVEGAPDPRAARPRGGVVSPADLLAAGWPDRADRGQRAPPAPEPVAATDRPARPHDRQRPPARVHPHRARGDLSRPAGSVRSARSARTPPSLQTAARRGRSRKIRRRPTLPGGLPPSTIGAGGLHFRVRNGNGCFPAAIATGNL